MNQSKNCYNILHYSILILKSYQNLYLYLVKLNNENLKFLLGCHTTWNIHMTAQE